MDSIKQKEHEDKVRYMHFARYLMLRVFTFGFLILNMNWLFINLSMNFTFGMILSLLMTIFSMVAVIEQISRIKIRKTDLPITRYFLYSEGILNFLLAVFLVTPIGKWALPFLTHKSDSEMMFGLLVIEIVICIIGILRISKINHGKDRYLKVIEIFEKEN